MNRRFGLKTATVGGARHFGAEGFGDLYRE